VLQNFARISTEQPDSFTPNRTHEDVEDTDPFSAGSAHEMESTHATGSGNTSIFLPSRARVDDPDSEEDDCIILEVLDPLPISYALPVVPVSADRDSQVLEHVVPLSVEVGGPPASQVRKASAPKVGSSGAPAPKRRKVPGEGPAREKKRKAITTSAG
jgi:hypothetical protein